MTQRLVVRDKRAYTISVYVLIDEMDAYDPPNLLGDIQAGIEAACGRSLSSGYLIKTQPGIPAKVSEKL